MDVGVWASIRQAKLDVIQSQLDLEKALIDVANDAGNAWDRWQQAIKEWVQMEAELGLRHEYLARQERLFREKQSIRLDVLGTRLNALQADANRWTAWYNLQLARLDVLRSTEQLLDYVEKAGIAAFPAEGPIPPPGHWKRLQLWLTRNRSGGPPPEEETSHGWHGDESLLAAGVRGNNGGFGRPWHGPASRRRSNWNPRRWQPHPYRWDRRRRRHPYWSDRRRRQHRSRWDNRRRERCGQERQ